MRRKRSAPRHDRPRPHRHAARCIPCRPRRHLKLANGRALTLEPTRDGILRVAQGRLWATRQGPHGGTPSDSGDYVLQAGRAMYVRAGERVVIEAWAGDSATRFAWDPVLVRAEVAVARPRVDAAVVLQPLADLRAAGVLACRAVFALGHGVLRLACDTPRMPRRFNAQRGDA